MSALRNGEGMEVVPGSINRTASHIAYNTDNAPEVIQVTPDMDTEKPGTQRAIGGLKRKTFWILVGVVILVAIIVAVVVPVVLTKKSQSQTNAEETTGISTNSTTTPGGMLDGSAFAAIPLSTYTMQFYYQNENGSIFYETKTDEKLTGGPAPVPGLTGAKVGTPLAAVSWAEGRQIRIFYLNDINELQEYSYNGSWAQGSLSGMAVQASGNSQLAAMIYGDSSEVRLYFQASGGMIQEYSWKDQTWSISQSLPVGISGTGLAALYYPPADIRVYYQTNEENLTIHEMSYGYPTTNEWGETPFSDLKAVATKGSHLTAVSWGNASTFDIRVLYHPFGSNSIAMYSWLNSTWEGPKTLVANYSIENSAMSAMSPEDDQFRLIYQDTTNSCIDLWTVE